MAEKSLKQLLADQKRKNIRVKRLEAELRSEKSLIANIDKSVTAKKVSEAKKKAISKKQ
jgi:hypothetical protein